MSGGQRAPSVREWAGAFVRIHFVMECSSPEVPGFLSREVELFAPAEGCAGSRCGTLHLAAGRVASLPAALTITCCPADFDGSGSLNPDDLGDYITCSFTQPPCVRAVFNQDNDVNADDLGDFITAYFAVCP